jgi:hypothetical protein
VGLLEGLQAAQPSQGSIQGVDLVAAAWSCLLGLVEWSDDTGEYSGIPGPVVHSLLCSPAARQVLLQQPGGVCSLEEVCGVLERCLDVDNTSHAVQAVVGLLDEPGLAEAALAVPGFAAAIVAHAVIPAHGI